ncbi:hypothetical protein D3C80_1948990 [compost metagenome]
MVLTAAGETALHEIKERQAAWADRLGAELGERRLRQASALMAEIIEVLKERSSPEDPAP